MRLTVERDPETVKRYAHVPPGRGWGVTLCAAACPGSERSCTRERGHSGPHVAHGAFSRVLAVWDGTGGEAPRSGPKRRGAVVRRPRGEVWTGGVAGALDWLWGRVVRLAGSVEEVALLIMFLGFLVFAVDWFLRILG